MDAMPFTNYVVKLEVTGKQIYQALENGISQIESGAGRYPQVSGIQFSYNPKLIPGARLLDVKLNGEKLDKNSKYTIAVVDFMANGGDGYTAFKGSKVLLDKNAGPLLSKVVSDYIQQKQTISPMTEGRIQITDKTSAGLYADLNDQNFEAVLSIMDLTNQGLIQAADQNNNFLPESIITRAEFVKVLVSALKLPVDNAKYLEAAQKAGILGSISKTEKFLRRDEMAVLLSNALPLVGNKLDATSQMLKTLDTFKDKESLNTTMKNDIAKTVFMGLIFGKTDKKNVTFAPNDLLTRTQASVVIERLLNLK
jgi:2',3'-cyclic-nucleotide 2'-phosphodiesterase/3'-nucleotidase